MEKIISDEYLEAYYQNEHDANKHMSIALAFTAILLSVIWVLYLTPLFDVSETTKRIMLITLPVIIVLLVLPMFFIRRSLPNKKWYKFFLVSIFTLSIAVLNVLIPKHAIMGWAICIVLTNHYYSPRLSSTVYVTVLIAMLSCIYLAMFYGEFDPNLLMGELDDETNLIHTYLDEAITFPDTPDGRVQYVHYLAELGRDRLFAGFVYYYIPRALAISVLFFVSYSLNHRTYNLFVKEIEVGSNYAAQSKDLEIAGEIQLSVLPDSFESNKDIEIIANLTPTKEVGGDFYDYYNLDDDHVAILIGDVSGKGSPAAMFMMKTITCFKNFVSVNKEPSQIIAEVNKSIYEGNKNNMFVTCFFGILNVKTGVMKFANAGHNPPVVGSYGNYHLLKCNSGFVLGGLEKAFVKDEELKLEKGESITLYTDGITEARNPKGEFYGEKRLIALYNRREFESVIELHYELKDDVSSFVNGAEQSDDITYLTLKFQGGKVKYKEIIVDAKKENIPQVVEVANEVLKKFNQTELLFRIKSIIFEVFSNVMEHAYNFQDGDLYFRMAYLPEKEMMSLTFIDHGVEFNVLEEKPQVVEKNNNILKAGNILKASKDKTTLDIQHIELKDMVDEHSYFRVNGKNLLNIKIKANKN